MANEPIPKVHIPNPNVISYPKVQVRDYNVTSQMRDTSDDLTFTSSTELRQFRNRVAHVPGCAMEVAIIDRETDKSDISLKDGDTLIPPVVLQDSRYLLQLVAE